MAEFLDIAQPIIEVDRDTNEMVATSYFEDYLYRIIQAVGGEGADTINTTIINSGLAAKLPFLFGLVSSMSKKLGSLQDQVRDSKTQSAVKQLEIDTADFYTKIKTENYTAVNKDYVEGRNNATIKLPANAKRSDQVMVANGDGSAITVDGNGNNIKYTSTDTKFITRNNGSSFHFHFFIDNVKNESYWRII